MFSTGNLQNPPYNYDTIASEALAYTYDTLNRLEEFYINDVLTEAYSFDSQGRLKSKGGRGIFMVMVIMSMQQRSWAVIGVLHAGLKIQGQLSETLLKHA